MKKKLPKILLFLIFLGLYLLPSLVFPTDLEYYYSLKGLHIPPIVFTVVWLIIYILMAIFCVSIFTKKSATSNKDLKNIKVFLVINYIIQTSFLAFFFTYHNLFLSYVICIFTFVTILIIALESLIVNKPFTLLTLPYIGWSIIASVLAIVFYLQN